MTNDTATALAALRAEVENICTDENGSVWGMVYLDNALPKGWSRHKFAGHLSDLKASGQYRPTYDPAFGEVRR